LIARIAIENTLVLLHDDRDFEGIAAAVTELQLFPEKKRQR
jgi:predicted nucleic acid-binding protein